MCKFKENVKVYNYSEQYSYKRSCHVIAMKLYYAYSVFSV